MRENKEKAGKTVRFSIRIPREQHEWLKKRSEASRGAKFESINRHIISLIEKEKGRYEGIE